MGCHIWTQGHYRKFSSLLMAYSNDRSGHISLRSYWERWTLLQACWRQAHMDIADRSVHTPMIRAPPLRSRIMNNNSPPPWNYPKEYLFLWYFGHRGFWEVHSVKRLPDRSEWISLARSSDLWNLPFSIRSTTFSHSLSELSHSIRVSNQSVFLLAMNAIM